MTDSQYNPALIEKINEVWDSTQLECSDYAPFGQLLQISNRLNELTVKSGLVFNPLLVFSMMKNLSNTVTDFPKADRQPEDNEVWN